METCFVPPEAAAAFPSSQWHFWSRKGRRKIAASDDGGVNNYSWGETNMEGTLWEKWHGNPLRIQFRTSSAWVPKILNTSFLWSVKKLEKKRYNLQRSSHSKRKIGSHATVLSNWLIHTQVCSIYLKCQSAQYQILSQKRVMRWLKHLMIVWG